MTPTNSREKVYQALAVSPGIAIGRVRRVIGSGAAYGEPDQKKISAAEVDAELARFAEAREATKDDIKKLQQQIRSKLAGADANIFDAHLLIVDDNALIGEVEKAIRNEQQNSANAFFRATERYAAAMEAIGDEYLKERALDIRDVAGRVLNYLADEHNKDQSGGENIRRIIVSQELTPSDTALLNRDRVLGFAVESGSTTSHTAILARSMHLPAVVGIPHELLNLTAGDTLIIDGYSGKVIVNPAHRTEEAYRLKQQEAGKLYSDLLTEKELQPETKDGFAVQLAMNLASIDEIADADKYGAYGVGLFRTEFMFLGRQMPPSEDEQFDIYKKLLLAMENKPVVIRTLDVGGDKAANSIYRANEANPFLGLRGVRLCLHERPDLFRIQLRALLRAGVFGDLKIMIPMLTCYEEVVEVRAFIDRVKAELRKEKQEFIEQVCLGAMIETPAAALMVHKFAPLVDFLSIGTNDLVQYTMSIDRSNERVAYLYRPGNPGLLELIKRCVDAARKHNIWVGVCGQMASEPQYIPLLVGLGVQELSMDSEALAMARYVVRSLKRCEAEAMAAKALDSNCAADSLQLSVDLLRKSAPKIAQLVMIQSSDEKPVGN